MTETKNNFIPVKKWNTIPVYLNTLNNRFCICQNGKVLAEALSYSALIKKVKINKLDKVHTMHLKDRACVIRNPLHRIVGDQQPDWVCGLLSGNMKDSWGRPTFEVVYLEKSRWFSESEIVFGDPEMAKELSELSEVKIKSEQRMGSIIREAKNLTKLIEHQLA